MSQSQRQQLNHQGFVDVFGPGRGHADPSADGNSAPAEPQDCTKCHDGVTGCGYHGPPGDDRGSIPCPNCQREAFEQFFLTGGDWLHGTTFSAAYALVKGTS